LVQKFMRDGTITHLRVETNLNLGSIGFMDQELAHALLEKFHFKVLR
jgi:hypothetical protein